MLCRRQGDVAGCHRSGRVPCHMWLVAGHLFLGKTSCKYNVHRRIRKWKYLKLDSIS